jgi:hypothetical protein
MKSFQWPRRAVLTLPLATAGPAAKSPFDRFGGLRRIALPATGHFQVQKLGSRWIFVTPEGHPFFALGVNHIGKFLSDPKQSSTFHARFQAQPAAATAFLRASLESLNFNAAEAFRPLAPEITRLYPHVEDITYPANEKYRFDIFDLHTRNALVEHVRRQAAGFAQDPMVLGAGFADQPVWTTPRMDYFRGLPAYAAGRKSYTQWLLTRHSQPDILRRLYGLPSTLDDALRVPIEAAKAEPQVKLDDEAYLGRIADAVYAALKEGVQAGAPASSFSARSSYCGPLPARFSRPSASIRTCS